MKHKIIYNDFAPLAAENATVPAAGSSAYQDAGNLLNSDARDLLNYATFEGNGINLLDFDLCFASEGDNIGYISSAVSTNSKQFSPSADIIIDLPDGLYSAPGITFHFWQNYCTALSVRWYQNDIQLMHSSFYPDFTDDDKAQGKLTFYCEQSVENFNKIIISFDKTELPNQFIKLAGIDLGKSFEITEFFGPISVFKEISDDCSDLPGSTCEFEARTMNDFTPQEAQELYVYSENELIGKFTVDNVTPNGDNRFAFECSDDIMKLDGAPFPSLEQGTHKMSDILSLIKDASNIDIDGDIFAEKELIGFMDAQKKSRTAVALIAFGAGCFISSDGRKLKMCHFRNTNIRIGANRIIGRAVYKQNSPFTAITLNVYNGSFDSVSAVKKVSNPLQKANNSVGEKIYDKFSLLSDADKRLQELSESGFYRNEITANIILQNERVGDIVAIETPHNGFKTGVIKSMDIILATVKTAKITIIERDFTEEV